MAVFFMHVVWFFLLFVTTLVAAPLDRHQQRLQKDLEQAQMELDTAKKMFNPWYAGPLLAPSPHMVPVGLWVDQAYVFVKSAYGSYSDRRKFNGTPNTTTFNPLNLFQAGLTKWLDMTFTIQGDVNWRKGSSAAAWGDTSLAFGFSIARETPTVPDIRFTVTESFPSGRYNRLKEGIYGTGSGAFETQIGLIFGKIFWWEKLHPLSTRLALTYTMSAPTNVHGLSVYGGGAGTRGKVKPGDVFSADLGLEWSMTQKWVIAGDIVYTYGKATHFSGTQGAAPVGGPLNDQLSLAPAIEYNPNSTSGLVAGPWFTVSGRNSSAFISAVLTYYIAW